MNQTIALIDDDRNILTSISIALEKEGFKVQTYLDGESALIGLSRTPPELAVIAIKMPKMTQTQIDEYLSRPNIANFVTLREDGSPHISPIWYQFHGGQLFIICQNSSVKAKNIGKDPRVAFSVATPSEPYRYVLIEGNASLTSEDAENLTLGISVHYLGTERGADFAKNILSSGKTIVITIIPHKIISWEEEANGST